MTYLATAERETEDPRVTLKRRYQQKRCLVCGARNRASPCALFCAAHIGAYRYCAVCGTVGTCDAHGRDKSRCRRCSSARATRAYHADPDRCLYRIRLMQMARRSGTRGDQIFESMRRRIALAALVAATPGWSWPQRARVFGKNAQQLAYNYRTQCAGPQMDVDSPDRMKRRRVR